MGPSTRCGVLAAVRVLWVALFASQPPLPGLRFARSALWQLPFSPCSHTLRRSQPCSAVTAMQQSPPGSDCYAAVSALQQPLCSGRRPAVIAMQQSLMLCCSSPQPSPVPLPIQGLWGCSPAVTAMQQSLLLCCSSPRPSPVPFPFLGLWGCRPTATAMQQSRLCNNRHAAVAALQQ